MNTARNPVAPVSQFDAAMPPASFEATGDAQLLTFSLGATETFAVPAGSVLEVIPTPKLTRIAGASWETAGVFMWRGDLLHVFHLTRLLGLPGTPEETLVVAMGPHGPVGFLAAAIGTIMPIPQERLRPLPESMKGNTPGILGIGLTEQNRLLSVINVAATLLRLGIQGPANEQALLAAA